jgi:hypothetical protein
MRYIYVLLIFTIFVSPCSFSQWSTPLPILTEPWPYGLLQASIAVSPRQEVAVVPWHKDTILCYFSTDNGRSFSRSVIASRWRSNFDHWILSMDRVAFDSHSNLYILWRENQDDGYRTWESFRIYRSRDGGKTFSAFWVVPFSDYPKKSLGLDKGGLFIDSEDRIHCIWSSRVESSKPAPYTYTRLSATDSSNMRQTVLPLLDSLYALASVDVYGLGDSVHVAMTQGRRYSFFNFPGKLYYMQSTDGGTTFSSAVSIDTLNPSQPRFVQRLNGELLLVHTRAPFPSHTDTALVVRRKDDSSFSEPRLLMENLGSNYDGPFGVRGCDSTLSVAYTRTYPERGVSYYQVSASGGSVVDSLFLPGHSSPDLATNSSGGKYLISVYQNAVYLSTKDVLLSIPDNHEGTPEVFFLGQNYPNPFNPATTIRYGLPNRSRVTLIVFNTLGQQIALLQNGEQDAGYYEVKFDGSGLSSGMYFYRLQAAEYVQARKLLLIR